MTVEFQNAQIQLSESIQKLIGTAEKLSEKSVEAIARVENLKKLNEELRSNILG